MATKRQKVTKHKRLLMSQKLRKEQGSPEVVRASFFRRWRSERLAWARKVDPKAVKAFESQ